MKATWSFYKKSRSEPQRNPTADAFFRRDDDRGPAAMIVREGIQNSLDAGQGDEPVRVRIFVSPKEGAARPADLRFFDTEEFRRHLCSEAAGLTDPPLGQRCPFLVFEDFGTTGLVGDVEHSGMSASSCASNPFYYFLRAEGANDKKDDGRGSWGVGKTVFFAASRINTVFVRSIRACEPDPREVVMGKVVLRHHDLDGCTYRPDAWYGVAEHDGFVKPVCDGSLVDALAPFRLERKDEPGLSILVPYVDENELRFGALLKAAIQEYAFPIATGALEVTVDADSDDGGNRRSLVVDSRSLRQAVKEIPDLPEADRVNLAMLADAAIGLAHAKRDPAEVTELRDPWPYRPDGVKGGIKWDGLAWLEDETLDRIRKRFESGRPIYIRVPVHVVHKNGTSSASSFLVRLEELDDPATQVHPICVRQGLTIPGAAGKRAQRVTGAHATIDVEQGPLSGLLRHAEDPSHMSWCHRTKGFLQEYENGKAYLEFVKSAPKWLLSKIRSSAGDEDENLFADLIGLSIGPRARKHGPKPGAPVTARPRVLEIGRAGNGFSVSRSPQAAARVAGLTVKCAYDCDSGDPFARFKPLDFDLTRPGDLSVETTGCTVERREANVLRVSVQRQDFRLDVRGFDSHRDLVVRCSPRTQDEAVDQLY